MSNAPGPMFDTECDCPRGPSRHPHAVHATHCATRLREKVAQSQLLYGECFYVVRDGKVVDVLNPSEVRPEPGVGVEPTTWSLRVTRSTTEPTGRDQGA